MLMLDLCCGLKGASASFLSRGWDVVTLDIDPVFHPDIVADLRDWEWHGGRPDLIWLSDPCTEFSRESMPWCKTGNTPDLSIVQGGLRVIRAAALLGARKCTRLCTVGAPLHGRSERATWAILFMGQLPPIGKSTPTNAQKGKLQQHATR